jgi:hypothetical protein
VVNNCPRLRLAHGYQFAETAEGLSQAVSDRPKAGLSPRRERRLVMGEIVIVVLEARRIASNIAKLPELLRKA